VEPGYGPTTSLQAMRDAHGWLIPAAYLPFAEPIFLDLRSRQRLRASQTCRGGVRAANDSTGQLRFPAGADAVALAQAR